MNINSNISQAGIEFEPSIRPKNSIYKKSMVELKNLKKIKKIK